MKSRKNKANIKKHTNISMIKLRNGFSQRYGLSRLRKKIQVEHFYKRTRIAIYNSLYEKFKYLLKDPNNIFSDSFFIENVNSIFCDYVFKKILDKFIDYNGSISWEDIFRNYLKEIVMKAPYNEVLDLIEEICGFLEHYLKEKYKGVVFKYFNDLFEMENIGYRFINSLITPITNEYEINEIEIALNNPFENCRTHIQNALRTFSDRNNRDYKNSIKEAISAIEAFCKNLPGEKNSILSKAIKSIDKHRIDVHPALKEAIDKLYAYTSKEGGLRHSERVVISKAAYDEAKFMLIICSSLLNFLTSKGIKIEE